MSIAPKQIGKVLALGDQTSGVIPVTGRIEEYRAITIAQATAGQSLALPGPTDTSIIFSIAVINTGTAAFDLQLVLSIDPAILFTPNEFTLLCWNGSAWSVFDTGNGSDNLLTGDLTQSANRTHAFGDFQQNWNNLGNFTVDQAFSGFAGFYAQTIWTCGGFDLTAQNTAANTTFNLDPAQLRIDMQNGTEGGHIYLDGTDGVTLQADTTSGASVTHSLNVRNNSIDMTFDASDGELNIDGTPGAAGEVLTSQGPGVPPVWAAGGGDNIYTADGTISEARAVTTDGQQVTFSGDGDGTRTFIQAQDTANSSLALLQVTKFTGANPGASVGYIPDTSSPDAYFAGANIETPTFRADFGIAGGVPVENYIAGSYENQGVVGTENMFGLWGNWEHVGLYFGGNNGVGPADLLIDGNAGTAGQILQSNGPGAAPTWENNPAGGTLHHAVIYDKANDGGYTGNEVVQFDAWVNTAGDPTYDPYSMVNAAADRINILQDGLYFLSFTCEDFSGNIPISFTLNGTRLSPETKGGSLAHPMRLSAGDYVGLQMQGGTGTQILTEPTFSVTQVGF